MKVIIAGSRKINNTGLVLQACIDSRFIITEIVCGLANGCLLYTSDAADE